VRVVGLNCAAAPEQAISSIPSTIRFGAQRNISGDGGSYLPVARIVRLFQPVSCQFLDTSPRFCIARCQKYGARLSGRRELYLPCGQDGLIPVAASA